MKILSHQLTTVSVLEAITPVAAFIGTVLSYISSMELCTSSCAEAHLWRFFGFPFDLLGLIFFPTLLALSLLEKRSSQFSILASWMLAGAFGSELVFIYIQKAIIQQWCPVCLSIAASVVLAIGARILLFKLDFDKVLQQGSAKMVKPLFLKVVSNFLFVIAGASIALMGAAKPETSFAEGVGEEKADPVFGNKDSEVEVYIVTDWFCPACLKVAPILDTAYPEIMKQARLMFIDRNIHSESLNFVPYNLSFMLNNKPEYFKIRHALEELAQKTKKPTAKQVQAAVAPLGVTYEPLDFADVESGLRFFQGISKVFEVNSTPTVVVANRKQIKAKKLSGSDINKETILKTIHEMQSK